MLVSWERTDADAPCCSRDFMSLTVASLVLAMSIALLSFNLSPYPKRTSCIFRSRASIVARLNVPPVQLHWINIYGLLFCTWPWTNLHFHHQPVWNLAVGTFQSEIWLRFKICYRIIKNHVRFRFLISGQIKRVKNFSFFGPLRKSRVEYRLPWLCPLSPSKAHQRLAEYCLKLLNAMGKSESLHSIWGGVIPESSPMFVRKLCWPVELRRYSAARYEWLTL